MKQSVLRLDCLIVGLTHKSHDRYTSTGFFNENEADAWG